MTASQPFFGFNLRIGSRGRKANPDTLILPSVSTMLRENSYEGDTDRSRGRPIGGV